MVKEIRHYYDVYSKKHQTYVNKKLITIENLLTEIQIIEDCIGFQYWLDDKIAEFMNFNEQKFIKIHKENPKFSKQIVVGLSLYRRNLQYLDSAYELASAGLNAPCYNLLRTVHESILAIWYVTTHGDESAEILEYMRNNKSTTTKYNHYHFLQSLYTGEMEKSMKKVYSGLSLTAHSNIFGMDNTQQYSIEETKLSLNSIILQSFYNIVSNIENLVQEPDLKNLILVPDVVSFIENLKKGMADENNTIGSYFPNKNNLSDTFVLYRP